MQEIKGNFWNLAKNFDVLCVTTNGVVKRNGQLVMGAGIAYQFNLRFPQLSSLLGSRVKRNGNIPYLITFGDGTRIMSVPTKQDYANPSPISLIRSSAQRVRTIVDQCKIRSILSTRPGCGLGNQDWTQVKKMLELEGWDDRFTIVSPGGYNGYQ
jgi:hypothetical protein